MERTSTSTQEENNFIREHGLSAYCEGHLGIDDEAPEDSKGHYKFPDGDFQRVHLRCGVLAVESRAGQYKHFDIERAAAHLHGMIDALSATERAGA